MLQFFPHISVKIRAFFCDFDGVFTDNSVFINEEGKETVKCNRSDGIGISKLKKQDIYFCIVSSEIIPLAKFRAKKLGVDCFTAVENKYNVINSILKKLNIQKSESAFLGNDINDLEAFKAVGLKIAVSDSYKEILESADIVLKKAGGYGAVREACELIINRNKT